MADQVTALCVVCHHYHPATSVSDERAKIIAEDAQDPADYYLMDEHLDQEGKSCKGSGRTPESITIEDEDDGFYLDLSDFPEDEPPPTPDDWLGPDSSAYDRHYAEHNRKR